MCVCVCVCVCTAAHSVQACYIVFYDLISYASVCVMAKTAGWLLWLSLSELRRSSSRCADHPPYCFLSGLLNYSTSLVSWGLSMCCPAPLSCRALSLSLSLSLHLSHSLSLWPITGACIGALILLLSWVGLILCLCVIMTSLLCSDKRQVIRSDDH